MGLWSMGQGLEPWLIHGANSRSLPTTLGWVLGHPLPSFLVPLRPSLPFPHSVLPFPHYCCPLPLVMAWHAGREGQGKVCIACSAKSYEWV